MYQTNTRLTVEKNCIKQGIQASKIQSRDLRYIRWVHAGTKILHESFPGDSGVIKMWKGFLNAQKI